MIKTISCKHYNNKVNYIISVCTFAHTVLSVNMRSSEGLLSRYSGCSLLFCSQYSL